ncbi:MAG: PAS domain-containing protein [Candidatus Thermoplasmatota archaeon]|nr:PAS domain-containing protein [Candidatus Thermoplasmatota archaeon]MBS3802258.1 PAS domain-containing protein [Candidatus Thermoplasmatota archaeon]
MDNYKDIIKELRHAEKMGFFESHAQMTDTDKVTDTENNKEKDEFSSTHFLHRDHLYFEEDKLDIDMIFSSVPLPMVFKNHEGVYTIVNKLFCELIGRKKEKIIGKTDFELFSEKRAKRFVADDRQVLSDEKNKNQMEKFSHPKVRWIRVSRNPVVNQGKVVGLICSFMDVTSEKALIASEKKMKLAMNAAHAGVWEWNLKTNMVFFDELALAMVGYTNKDFKDVLTKGSWWMDQFHPEDKHRIESTFQKFISGEIDTYSVEFRLKRKDEGYTWISSYGLIMSYDENGEPEVVIGIHQDITNRKNVDWKLKQRQNLLKQGEKLANMGSWELDVETGIIVCSDQWQRIHGTLKSEYRKDDLIPIAHPDDRKRVMEALDNTINKKLPYYIEHRIIRQDDKKIRLIKAYGEIFKDQHGNFSKIKGYARDITGEKETKEELEENKKRLEIATDSAGIGVWDLDIKTNVLTWDKWMYRIYGVNESSFQEAFDAWQNGVHPDDLSRVNKEVEMAQKGEKDFDTKFRIVRPTGEIRYVKGNAIVIHDERGKPVRMTGINYDITEEKKAEEKVKEKIDELQRWKKMTVGRELKMIELKKENEKLKKELTNSLY